MPHKTDEKQLVDFCIKGNRQAQRLLFERYGRRMMAVCLRYGRHRQEAEDMLQDGFIRVFSHLHTFNFKGPLEAWIRRVIVNAALRSVKIKSFSHEEIGLPEYHDSPIPETALTNMSEEEILNLVTKLPHGYRTVFNLYVIEGYSHKEIAEIMDFGESTSRSQLAKARKILQKMILASQRIAV